MVTSINWLLHHEQLTLWANENNYGYVCFQLQDKRETSGVQSYKLRDLQQEASDKIKVCPSSR